MNTPFASHRYSMVAIQLPYYSWWMLVMLYIYTVPIIIYHYISIIYHHETFPYIYIYYRYIQCIVYTYIYIYINICIYTIFPFMYTHYTHDNPILSHSIHYISMISPSGPRVQWLGGPGHSALGNSPQPPRRPLACLSQRWTDGVWGVPYPLVMTNIAMENHHVSWENSLFLWPFSIVFCMFTRGYFQTNSWGFENDSKDENWRFDLTLRKTITDGIL